MQYKEKRGKLPGEMEEVGNEGFLEWRNVTGTFHALHISPHLDLRLRLVNKRVPQIIRDVSVTVSCN